MASRSTSRCLKLVLVLIFITCVINMAIHHFKPTHHHQIKLVTVGAVAADSQRCSLIGKNILEAGGSSVDSAIATLLCCGVQHPHSSGIGGGGVFIIYDHKLKKSVVIDGKTPAPYKANRSHFPIYTSIHSTGPLSIGIPNEIVAFWEAHQRYGKLPWEDLFAPAIAMLKNGVPFSKDSENKLNYMTIVLLEKHNVTLHKMFPGICELFCHENGEVKKEGEIIYRPHLLRTLKKIAEHGADYLYKGEGAELLISDLQKEGAVLTLEDLEDFRPSIYDAYKHEFEHFVLTSTDGPHFGIILAFILRVLEGYNITNDHFKPDKVIPTYHLLTEIMKWAGAYSKRIGDPKFAPGLEEFMQSLGTEEMAARVRKRINLVRTEDREYYTNVTTDDLQLQLHGTTHVSILGTDGDAVSATSSINNYFGSLIYSKSTGIILNNSMKSFNNKNGSHNMIVPGKIAKTGQSPSILLDKNDDLLMVIGASGGDRIATSLAQALLGIFWLNQTLEEAIRPKRIHFDFRAYKLLYETGFAQNILDALENKYGHVLLERDRYMSNIQAVYKNPITHQIDAFSDERKGGHASLIQREI
ncbi:glutathione hydrolase 1 proenzyme [Patella vulgata]|uniref:glutathione hydrolase 1 proenzyme n=1 Tax=Patella vulgata TaxID=6465 RepID=UPI00217F4ED8|nr:glutathione hydrolase 1 proenzyme [Patella vulgata]